MGTEAPDMLENNEYPNCRTMKGTSASELNSDRRERVVKAWIERLEDSDILNAYLGGLYDIGALKMPEDKQ